MNLLLSLQETAQLLCAPILPWAKTRAHGNRLVCRVPRRPAHGKTKAHGKRFVCRVLANKTHGKLNTHGKTPSLPSVYFMEHGKEAVRGGMARGPCICRVPHCGTRQTQIFAVCFPFGSVPWLLHTANHLEIFWFFTPYFLWCLYILRGTLN